MPQAVVELRDRVAQLRDVEIRLDGSSATGSRTELSDWDFDIRLPAETSVEALVPAAENGDALAVFWDPLSRRANLIVLLDGPVKVDLIAADRPNPALIERWEVTATTLTRLDAHFWDWTLWLGAKHLRGLTQLVHDHLDHMHDAILVPLGVPESKPIPDIASAVAVFIATRDARAAELGVAVDGRLQHQVVAALRRYDVIPA